MVGVAGAWSWSYAIKNHRLLLPEVTEQYAYRLRDRILAEPITAGITITIRICRTDPLGNLLADLSAGGLVGQGPQTGKKAKIGKKP